MPGDVLPAGIWERDEQLGGLLDPLRATPSSEADEIARLMVQQLHIAVHGDTWARPESPRQVWLQLLREVVTARRQEVR